MISWDRVRELRQEIGEEDFSEVVTLFLEEVEEVLERMRDSDPTSHEADLHFLKGSALNLGFEALGAICRAGQTSAANRRIGSDDIEQVRTVYADSKRQFLADRAFKV